ncbi:hypothetical protein [Salinisphaera sp. Q1T1-3]|uniref:hypothetical protein n=1 Tax=Salinisphaera sp. Q1T1-3 TaxID=2321229 RepID=UPI000E71F24F|nr:hypothetical protein [Salinisphaera sp. Q1T1-3]RJS94333.1 hypothetical protein D3260_04290 [Salinisphaera sp. Q1T1-3]
MTDRRARWTLAALVAVFAAPVVAAWGLYHGLGWRGDGTAAAGRLVIPAVRLPETPVTGRDGATHQDVGALWRRHWTMLQVAPDGCRDACQASLRQSRQVRAVLHTDAARVQRMLILGDNTSPIARAAMQPDLAIYRTKVVDWRPTLAAHAADAPGTILLIDPAGRWMASYPPPADADALHHDINRLLAQAGRP